TVIVPYWDSTGTQTETATRGGIERSLCPDRLMPIAPRPRIDRLTRCHDARFDAIAECFGLRSAEDQGEAANDARDAQVIVVERRQPVIIRLIEGQHPRCGAAQISLHALAVAQMRDVLRAENRSQRIESARF